MAKLFGLSCTHTQHIHAYTTIHTHMHTHLPSSIYTHTTHTYITHTINTHTINTHTRTPTYLAPYTAPVQDCSSTQREGKSPISEDILVTSVGGFSLLEWRGGE